MSHAAGESAVRGRERIKRWLRIHMLSNQSRDLFYPICRQKRGPMAVARILLDGPRRVPNAIHINGVEVVLANIRRDGTAIVADLARPELVLPGENVVSLPTDCNPRALRLEGEPAAGDGAGPGWGGHTAEVRASDPHLAAAAHFLVGSLSEDIFGEGQVSLTAWDPTFRCSRLWSWYWTTGIVYEALVRLCEASLVNVDLAPLERGLLARQILDGEDTRGSYMVRWDPDRTLAAGVVPWHAPNDAAYLGLHGLLVAHERSGDDVWLERADLLADWIMERGTRGGRLRVGWDGQRCRWDDSWHYIDAAWTPAFFLALAERSGRLGLAEFAEACARDTIERFGTDSPYYLKIWRENGRHTRSIFSRGMAWILEGWLPLLVAGHDWLRPRVVSLVEALLSAQRADGAWPYLLNVSDSGACSKGVPVLAHHLNRARPLLPELGEAIEASVVRAMGWCEEHMDLVPDSPGRGGIVAANSEGAISTVRNIPLAINYASAYYILTRLERGI